MIRLMLDTEFTDFPRMQYDIYSNSTTRYMTRHNLISIGLYGGSDELSFYGELNDYPSQYSSEFVKLHVEPLLGSWSHNVYDENSLRESLTRFLYRFEDSGIELLYDSEYDWDLFKKLMVEPILFVDGVFIGGRIDLGKFVEYQAVHGLDVHHALSDAKANHYAYTGDLD